MKNLFKDNDIHVLIMRSNRQISALGGGIAIISGAQTRTPAIGLSAPNALISQFTFSPSVTEENLASYTFNIVPARDIVPTFDDLSTNFQRIRCTSNANSPAGCHSSSRSICELLYTCGSHGRPIPCNCVHEFHYEIPKGKEFLAQCPKPNKKR